MRTSFSDRWLRLGDADEIYRLTAINAVQLAVALIANLILLLNMAKKIRFAVAQPITIVTWYISSLCLIALTATAAGPLKGAAGDNYIWSGAFYYGLYAACLYFFCSTLMVVTFWGAVKGKYSKDFQLTTSQRTLMLQTIMFLVYLLVGALVFSTTEGWAYLDAVYWADVTLFTVGFGDYYPESSLGRALLFPYALVGVISLGLVVGSIRSLVLDRGRRQLAARMVEKKRKRILKRMVRRGKDDILIPVTDDEGDGSEPDLRTSSTGLSEFERRQMEFELMRKIQAESEHRRRWMAMGISTTVWLILWLVGAAIFQQCEIEYQGWSYFDGFYFAFVSLTTIGYGDVSPISPSGKSFFVFWSLLALPTMTILISNAGDTVIKLIRDWTDWLGTITILPGERGVKRELKVLVRALPIGRVFGDDSDVEESPPGFLGNSPRHEESTDSEDDQEKRDGEGNGTPPRRRIGAYAEQNAKLSSAEASGADSDHVSQSPGEETLTGSNAASTDNARRPSITSQPQKSSTGHLTFADPPERPAASHKTDSHKSGSSYSGKFGRKARGRDINSQTVAMSRAMSIPRTAAQLPKDVPEDQYEYAVVLIDEIGRVTQHIRSQPPRKYSFEEWAWYLKLIGEDECSAETHHKPVLHSRKKAKRAAAAGVANEGTPGQQSNGEGSSSGNESDKTQWSWVGARSPLMGSQEEAEWILTKLQERLSEQLRATRDEARAGNEDAVPS